MRVPPSKRANNDVTLPGETPMTIRHQHSAQLAGLRARLRGAGRNYDDLINRSIVGLCRQMGTG